MTTTTAKEYADNSHVWMTPAAEYAEKLNRLGFTFEDFAAEHPHLSASLYGEDLKAELQLLQDHEEPAEEPAQPKLSKAGKMPCRSWSLQALITCPAAKQRNGELVPACKGCYATTGNYNFPNVKAPRAHNKEDWKKSDWVQAMISELDNDRYFRWFDSGDMYNLRLAEKILEVMKATPWTRHWLPTRMHKFAKFAAVIEEMQALPNVVVRLSGDGVNGEIIEGAAVSTIIPTVEEASPAMTVCEAYERDGKCGSCRSCWDKQAAVIAYPAHGKKMLSLIAKAAA